MTPLVTLPLTAVNDEASEAWPDTVGRLFDEHHRRLYRLARRLTRNEEDAHDLVQEAFVRVARRPGRVPAAPRALEAWLVRIVVNLCRDRARRLAVRARPLERNEAAPVDSEARAVARVTIEAALQRLSPRRRAVVVLRELEERPVAEVAQLLGVTGVTVRWHLAAARKQLARWILDGEGAERES